MTKIDRRQMLRDEYMARINRVIDHIDRNISKDLGLEDLARVAHFSRFHFHRIFHALVGETLNAFIQRLRLERAANQLTDNPKKSITAVALDCGFSGSAAFARAFKERFGMSASEWREGLSRAGSKNGQAKSKGRQTIRKKGKEPAAASGYPVREENRERRQRTVNKMRFQVEVKELPELNVAYIRHVGPFQGVAGAFDRLMRWAGPRGLVRFPETKVLAVYHDNPDITETDKLRSSACITVPPETAAEGEIGRMKIPGGLFAVARFEIAPTEFGDAWDAFMCNWLPESGYQPDDRMCYEVYLNNPKDHPQGKFIIEIHEPIRPL
jgi:AraC family transcriptional regulator